MRLFDLVSQSTSPPLGMPQGFSLPCAYQFAAQVRQCPLRVVLAGDLVHAATMLAYSDGDRLAGCLDLVHAPMQSVWIEWLESERQAALLNVPNLNARVILTAKRGGVLVNSDKSGRAGTIRTFWSLPDDVVHTGSVLTDFDLDNPLRQQTSLASVFDGQRASILAPEEPAIDMVLSHAGSRFDPAWAGYYRSGRLSELEQTAVLHSALGTTAYDTPMLFALFLLMTAKDGVHRRSSELSKLNRARQHAGRPPLLEHVEAALRLSAQTDSQERAESERMRRPSRMHRVRGHLARRGNKIFWRTSHLRGSARQGAVQTRTVSLSF
jgi:hypothetical protein